MLDIKTMSDDDKFFNFMSGLQGWAQTKLWMKEAWGLHIAMAATNCLVDYKMGGTMSITQKAKPWGIKKAKIEADFQQASLEETKRKGCCTHQTNRKES